MMGKEAKEKMNICQKAVPAWIMPMNKVIDTLNPAENKFDIVIIDEASQSDISSLVLSIYGIEWCVLCVFGAESSDAYFGANG